MNFLLSQISTENDIDIETQIHCWASTYLFPLVKYDSESIFTKLTHIFIKYMFLYRGYANLNKYLLRRHDDCTNYKFTKAKMEYTYDEVHEIDYESVKIVFEDNILTMYRDKKQTDQINLAPHL